MLNILHSFFNNINANPKYVHRDELDKKARSPSILRRRAYRKAKEAKPMLYQSYDQEEKQALNHEEKKKIRVKVLMTKEEAARLLSRCKDGGSLEFSDVAKELAKIPANRIRVVDSSSTKNKGRVLESIAEEI